MFPNSPYLMNIVAILLIVLESSCGKKKDHQILKGSRDLLDTESSKLAKEGASCHLASITRRSLDNLRVTKQVLKARACHIKYLQTNPHNGWVWGSLGQVFQDQGGKQQSQVTACFKQATKLTGKVSSHVEQWSFLGPFVIGKPEIDGDPVESFGGIFNVSSLRFKKSVKFLSELVPDGTVSWRIYKQLNPGDAVQIAPQVNWNDFINSLGSIGIMEWQGWVVGEFLVNENKQNILIQCLGVHTIFVDRTPITGDVYRRQQFWFSVQLNKGVHTIYIRLRTVRVQQFQCSIKSAPTAFEILQPSFMPDLYDGYLFGTYISLPISNMHAFKWLRNIKVTLNSQSLGAPLKIVLLHDAAFAIAPGQVCPIIFQLTSNDDRITKTCSDITFKVKVSTSEGQLVYPITLRCRKRDESAIFTFLDHDGSIQHGATIHPISTCENDLCPVVLTQHGTTVPAQNQADSYKRMEGGKYVFGADHAWLLAPTRHGAHNWEGPGALTAMTALDRLAELVQRAAWITLKASDKHVIFAGHSMGGHGAWHLATHYPDRALAVVSLAGWNKKETYGESNLFFKHDISISHVDPAVKAVMEACIAENEADRHASNLQGIPVLARIGAADRTIHPFFVRRMYRVLKEWGINVSYTELPDKEHWWWDTWETNDGGAVNDRQLRDFTNQHSDLPTDSQSECSSESDSKTCNEVPSGGKYSQDSNQPVKFTYTLMNPAFGETMRGLQVIQQQVPFRTSTIQGEIMGDRVTLTTVNVARFRVTEPYNRPVRWKYKTIQIDRQPAWRAQRVQAVVNSTTHHFCKVKGIWQICSDMADFEQKGERGPRNLGPARRVAESKFLIVIGSQAGIKGNRAIQEFAVYIANLFFLTSDAFAPVVKDTDLTDQIADQYNLIIIGNPTENSFTQRYLDRVPLIFQPGNADHGATETFIGKGPAGNTGDKGNPYYAAELKKNKKSTESSTEPAVEMATSGNTGSKGNPYYAEELTKEKSSDSSTEPPIKVDKSGATGAKGNPYYAEELTKDTASSVEPPIQRVAAAVTGDRGNVYYAQQLLQAGKGIRLGSCHFSHPQTSALFLAPHSQGKLALVLLGNSLEGLRDAVSLATPTIPPMTRSPFSNLVPDFVITGPDFRAKGPGGYLCAGFWGNQWHFTPELASCAHCV